MTTISTHPTGLDALPMARPADSAILHFYLMRHGQTEANAGLIWQGWKDSLLTATGREQVRQTAVRLAAVPFDYAISSDSGRAVASAQILMSERSDGLTFDQSPELRERCYGGYEGLTTPQAEAQYPDTMFDPARVTRMTWRPPSGETLTEVLARVTGKLQQIAEGRGGSNVLVATHGNVLRLLDAHSRGLTLDDEWLPTPRNASVLAMAYRLDTQTFSCLCRPAAE